MGNIHPTAKIHPSTFIHPTALIGPNVIIGENCYIGPYCVIGFPPEWKGKEEICKGVVIEDDVRLTKFVTIDSGAQHPTFIGCECYFLSGSHFGHDAVVMDLCTVACGAKIGGHAKIGLGCNIGLNAVIHQKITIPEGCMIGASAFIGKTLEMKPYSKYAGVPARYIGENVRP